MIANLKKSLAIFAVGISFLCLSNAARAQDYWTLVPPPLTTLGWTNIGVAASTFEKENRERWAAEDEEERSPRTQPTVKLPTVDLSFKASPQTRKSNFVTYVARLAAEQPGSASELGAALDNPQFMPMIASGYDHYGLDTNDLADVFLCGGLQCGKHRSIVSAKIPIPTWFLQHGCNHLNLLAQLQR